jgi:hypothetical protein
MRRTKVHRLVVTALAVSIAAVAVPAGSGSLPDGDTQGGSATPATSEIATKVRHEPPLPALEASAASLVADPASVDGFDWADAGIGGGIALGIAALLGGSVIVVRRTRHNDRLATP